MITLEAGNRYYSRCGSIRVVKSTGDDGNWAIYTEDGEFVGKCAADGRLSQFSNSPDDLVNDYVGLPIPELAAAAQDFNRAKTQLATLEQQYFEQVWKSIPAEYSWIAMDEDDRWFQYVNKPKLAADQVWGESLGDYTWFYLPYASANWKKSRQRRPQQKVGG